MPPANACSPGRSISLPTSLRNTGGGSTLISYADFEKVDLRVGRVVAVEEFPEARRPAYKLTIDLGPLGLKRSSAQITNYRPEELQGRQVICVVNFPLRQVGPFRSE